jgi:hypothetical protein
VSIYDTTGASLTPSEAKAKPDAQLADEGPVRWTVLLALLIGALVFGALDGYVAYVIESPGTSLAGHCLLVAVIAVAAASLGWSLFRSKSRRFRITFTTSILIAGLLATWWSWAFAMPAAMSWDTHATPRALEALKGIGVERSVCVIVTTGSIGPLHAPYQQCAINGQPGSQIQFTARSGGGKSDVSPARGLIFTETAANTLSDLCTRHLVGDWYAFTADPSGKAGYSCRGGF